MEKFMLSLDLYSDFFYYLLWSFIKELL